MSVNKSSGNMYPDKDTINPLKGECPHDCSYCYVKGLKKQYKAMSNKYTGPIALDDKVLNKKLPEGKEIFVCSCHDLFSEEVPDKNIKKILKHCQKYDNLYLFQSKNPWRLNNFIGANIDIFPVKFILGTTIETNRDLSSISKAPCPIERSRAMMIMSKYYPCMVSIEPVMDFDPIEFFSWFNDMGLKYVSIGADSKKHGLPEPDPDKLLEFIRNMRKITKVKLKKNLQRFFPDNHGLCKQCGHLLVDEYYLRNNQLTCRNCLKTKKVPELDPIMKAREMGYRVLEV